MPAGSEGWIKLHRKFKDSPIYHGPPKIKLLFLEILIHVSWEEGDFDFLGPHKVDLEKGQWLVSYQELADKINTSKSTVQRYLDMIKNAGMLKTRIETRGQYSKTLITVVNWSKYQDSGNEENGIERGPEHAVERAVERQCTKEVKNKEISTEDNKLSYQQKQQKIVDRLQGAQFLNDDQSKAFGLAGKWINAYGYNRVVTVLDELDCKDKWETVKDHDSPIGYIVEWLKNYEDGGDDTIDKLNQAMEL